MNHPNANGVPPQKPTAQPARRAALDNTPPRSQATPQARQPSSSGAQKAQASKNQAPRNPSATQAPRNQAPRISGYKLKRILGKGGMATVYLAVQESFGREVALKVMAPELVNKRDFAKRFEMEARMVAKLSHPNIVTVYDVGMQDSHFYLAMEYHPNGHLGEQIKKGLTPKQAMHVAKKLADALHFAHENSIVHRDLKPDNVLFSARGVPVITDFGIARDNSADSNLTQIGSTVGTPKYMSPEQAKGQRVDGRSDLYGLGVIIYEMLMGEPPFRADDPVTLAIKHCKDPIPRMPLVYEDYQPLVDKLMSKEAANRYPNGAAVVAAIDALEASLNPAAAQSSASGAGTAQNTPPPMSRPERKDALKTIPKAKKQVVEEAKAPEPVYEVEDSISGSFLSKRVTREIAFGADDYDQFEKQFSRASKDIAEWRGQYGKKAKQLDFVIEAHPWIHRRILDKLNGQFSEQHPYGAFSLVGTITVHLFDEVDKKGERYIVRENGKIPAE